MLTIFTIPKPFSGHINVIQRNAIKSWMKLSPKCEIILLGSEGGVKEVAEEFGLKHIANVERNEFGAPLLDSAFKLAKENSSKDILCYVNCDIILIDDFIKAILRTKEKFPEFLIFSQRWDADIKEPLDFEEKGWREKIKRFANRKGQKPVGMDSFIFFKGFSHNMPPFAVGRPSWDNWFLYNAKFLKIPSIDITKDAFLIHQNHNYNKNYSHFPTSENGKLENKKNFKLMGSIFNNFTQRDADWFLSKGQIFKRRKVSIVNRYLRFFATLPDFYPYFNLWQKILCFPVFLISKAVIKIKHFYEKKT